MLESELSKQICKIGGPFVLLICCPVLVFICYELTKKDMDAGILISTKWIVEMSFWNISFFAVGIISTYKGYEDRF